MIDTIAVVFVRRQWNDWREARYRLEDVKDLHWDTVSGGVYAPTPQPFVHGYVQCNGMIDGELAHPCRHGRGPHSIKVCLVKKANRALWPTILQIVGPRPSGKKGPG
jgi:hypothetical protein